MRLTRRHFVRRAVAAALGLTAAGRSSPAAWSATDGTLRVAVRNGARAFAGDRARFATISPRSAGSRANALLDVVSDKQLDAMLEVVNRNRVGVQVVSRVPVSLRRGHNEIAWAPPPSTRPGSYVLRLRREDATPAPVLGSAVVRILDVEATFRRRSALPGETVALSILTDAPWLRLTLLQCGSEPEPTNSNYDMRGIPVGEPQRIDLSRHRGRLATVPVTLNVTASGVYAARLDGPSGHKGFAPLVVRPPAPVQRVAVVIPTTTWHAYNYYDRNGDGYGDTWYSLWAQKRIDLTRPHLRSGVPERWRSYDVQFMHWLASRGHLTDVYADEDIDRFPDPTALRAAYDLIVFPGHTEYVTGRLYDLIQGFRDLGGRLVFLSANNFFRRVVRDGSHAKLIGEWRNLGRPEAALLGSQYLANDDGRRQEPFTIVGADIAPWAFAGTGLGNGSAFGRYGIEIDATTPLSPPGTQVLARIPDLLGPGRTAEMTYYETEAGARVFSAGVLNFGGTIMLWQETARLLDNVWARMSADL
jgi:N,N-dimethylformamidase beta subunit-like, C-terminal